MAILVTGGAGYIGSHTCVELLEKGYEIIIVDNLSNSKKDVLENIKKITNKTFKFYKTDILDNIGLNKIFAENNIEAVIHFAGHKSVNESIKKPVSYYDNNINGSLNLCKVMIQFNVKKIIFSSSATVYGNDSPSPLKEEYPLNPTNPYGWTKFMIEQIFRDVHNSDKSWSIITLRYFNPIGAHKSGLIGEEPNGIPNNLMPYIVQVGQGKLKNLKIFGDNYETHDGTGVRDYIHVVDLAKGHLKSLEKLLKVNGLRTYNLGTGKGYSVLDVVKTFERVNNIKIPYEITKRRTGDIAISYADVTKINKEIGWFAEKNLEEMCKDSWLNK